MLELRAGLLGEDLCMIFFFFKLSNLDLLFSLNLLRFVLELLEVILTLEVEQGG